MAMLMQKGAGLLMGLYLKSFQFDFFLSLEIALRVLYISDKQFTTELHT